MTKTLRFLTTLFLAAFFSLPASAAEIAPVGALTFSNVSVSDPAAGYSVTTSTKSGIGGGVLLNFHLLPETSLEIGGLYIKKKLDLTTTASGVTATASEEGYYFQVPVLARFWLSRELSVGAGGFWERGMTGSFNTGVRNDYGAVASVALRLPLGSSGVHFLADGRYYYGLKNVSGVSQYNLKYRDIQALVGLAIPFGDGHHSRY